MHFAFLTVWEKYISTIHPGTDSKTSSCYKCAKSNDKNRILKNMWQMEEEEEKETLHIACDHNKSIDKQHK